MQDKQTYTPEESALIGKIFQDIKNFYIDDSGKKYPPRSMDSIINIFSQDDINNIYNIIDKSKLQQCQ